MGTEAVNGIPPNHPDAEKPKGMIEALRERESVWDRFLEELGGKKPIEVCKECKTSAKKKEALAHIRATEEAGQDGEMAEEDLREIEEPETESSKDWCCTRKVLSLQQDFLEEKPMLQHYIDDRGHICLFLPKFHCELNPIELYWGFGKYKYRETNEGRFGTAKELVPCCLDLCSIISIYRFFQKCWQYMNSYRLGLDFVKASLTVKKYKLHCRILEREVQMAIQQ